MALPLPLLVPALAPLEADLLAFLAFERYFLFLGAAVLELATGDLGAEVGVKVVGVTWGEWGLGDGIGVAPGGKVFLSCLSASCMGRVVLSIEGRWVGLNALATGSVGFEV